MGILGYGWDLTSSSLITRTGKSFYYDNSAEAPSLSVADNLILDGQRLFLVSGVNLTNGAKYRTEVETYSEITYKVINSFACFEVKTKDGRVLEYGSTDNSYIETSKGNNALFWLLSKVTDNNGNVINYTYNEVKNNGEFYLTNILYGGDRKIVFTYEDRPDKQIGYIAGVSVNNRKILKKISTYIGNVLLKEYLFNHINDGFYSKLTEIIEKGPNAERYNPTLINYGSKEVYASEKVFPLSENRQGNKPIFADFNGDGKTDFLSYPEKDSYTSSDIATLFLATSDNYGNMRFNKQCTIPLTSGFSHIIPADMNGDSKIDAVVVSLAPNGTYRYSYYLYENDKFVYNYLGFNTNGQSGIAGDFNGDGKFEILVQENQKVFDGEGREIASGGIDDWGTTYVPCFSNNLYLSDFNGNGKTDLLVMNASRSWIYELSGNKFVRQSSFETTALKNVYFPYFADFNGDGKTDIIYQNVQSGNFDDVHLLISTGTNFVHQTVQNTDIRSKVSVGDFNKDGKSDIYHMEIVNGAVIMKVGLYNGTNFVTKRYSSILKPEDFNVPIEYDSYLYPVADFDGDGRAEFCCARFANSYVIHTFDDEQTLLVKTVTNGLGEYTSFNYEPITENYICNIDEKLTFPLTNPRFPLYVVNQINVGGNNYSDYTTYSYKNPRIHKQGKGFLGFGEIVAKNNSTAINTVTRYGYDRTYYYPWILEQKSLTNSGTLIQTITNENATVYEGSKRFYPYISKRTIADHLKGSVITETSSNLEYGNPKTIIKDYGNGLTETRTSVFNNVTTGNKWILGLPKSIEIRTTQGAISWKDKTAYEYNTNNQVYKKSIFTNTGSELVAEETYTYDKFGNVKTSVLKSYSSSNMLTTTYQYSSNGVYETGMTDPLNRVTVQTYNSLGQLVSTTDMRENVTTYEYDGLGRLKKSNYPDGTNAVITWAWNSIANGIYSVTMEESGKPTETIYYDSRGLERRKSQLRFDGTKLLVDKTYDIAGRLAKVSLPFKGNSPSLWNTYIYDEFGRLQRIAYASGKVDTYTYSGASVTETKNGISIIKTYNAKDELIRTSDSGGIITYQLRPDGQPSSITAPGNVTTNFSYDKYGRQIEINDPSIGVKIFGYDISGNINYEKDANGKEKNMTYNAFGQLTKRVLPEYTTTFIYDRYGELEKESSTNGISKTYEHDKLGRLLSSREDVNSHWTKYVYTYSSTTGLPESKEYLFSSGGNSIKENYTYKNGVLTEIKQNGQSSIWKLLSEDTFGHPSQVATGSLNRTYSYDKYGLPTARKVVTSTGTVVQDFGMLFDPSTGNLKARGDNKYNKFEQFRYDNLNRLTQVFEASSLSAQVTTSAKNLYDYYQNGNLSSKNDVGAYSYKDGKKPYAVTAIESNTNAIPPRLQQIVYTSFERAASITENGYVASFTYNGSGDRAKMEIRKNNNNEILRYYLNGNYEVDQTPAGVKERLYLGGDAYSAPAVLVKESGSWNLYYICRDYLGSITQITNNSGVLQQELSYDAWGRLRSPNTLVAFTPGAEPQLALGRGYTGHEYLTMFGLVNMNARLYDPAVGRFLSPDPYVQMPDFTQSYNRFSYAMNNPLAYIDPDGENPLLFIGFFVGAYIGGVASNNGELNPVRWDYSSPFTYLGVFLGAVGGYYGAYGIVHPGSIAFAGSINSPWISVGASVAGAGTGLGAGTDWDYNFHWSTTGGGGGEYGHFGDIESSINQGIGKAQLNYYNNQAASLSTSFILSSALSGTSEVLYSKHFNTWMGKDLKVRSQNWGGNQFTGGKNKFARSLSKKVTWGGNILGAYSATDIFYDFSQKEISFSQMIIEESSNAFSTLGGIYGAAWGIGWEIGRQTTNQTWYQQVKYHFWYNRMENRYGSPSEKNKVYWDNFNNNYKQ